MDVRAVAVPRSPKTDDFPPIFSALQVRERLFPLKFADTFLCHLPSAPQSVP